MYEMEAIREREEFILRDEDELEGSLLPAAVPIPWSSMATASSMSTQAVFDQTPTFAIDNEVLDAIPIPNMMFGYDPEHEKELLRQADRSGAIDVEEERRIAQRERQRLYALECTTKSQIRLANQRARELHALEELRGGSEVLEDFMAKFDETDMSTSTQALATRAPELHEGTFGKEYDVKPYDVNNYETQEYLVSKYKSVYES
jgi:hypothetical protein